MAQVAPIQMHPVAIRHLEQLAQLLGRVPADCVSGAIELLLGARTTGHRVYVMGNGGSAATASHFACDLSKTARVANYAPLRVFALSDNGALMTAWANDTVYDRVFSEQILALVEPGDVVIAISASGNSRNILAGLEAAHALSASTIALVGFDGGVAATLADITVHIPSCDYGLVEDCHSALGHAITRAVRTALNAESLA